LAHPFKVIIECDAQGGYVAIFPELLGRRAQAASLKTLMERIREETGPCPELDGPAAAPSKQPAVACESPGDP
jgi:hypothetical protein